MAFKQDMEDGTAFVRTHWAGWRRASMRLGGNLAVLTFNVMLIALIWAAVAALVRSERQETIRAAINRNDDLAIAFEQYTIRTIEGADAAVRFLAREYVRNGGTIDVGRLVADATIDHSAITGVIVTDERGNAVANVYKGKPLILTNMADREHVSVHVAGNSENLFVGKPVVGRITGNVSIPFTRRINKPDGSFGGTAMALVPPGRFTDVLQDAKIRALDVISLVGLDGITRARLTGTNASWGEDISDSPLFTQAFAVPVGHYVGKDPVDGVLRLVSYRTIPKYRLMTIVGVAEADVMANFSRREFRYFLAAGLMSAVIAAFTALLMLMLASQRRAAAEAVAHDIAERKNAVDAANTYAGHLRRLARSRMELEEEERRRLGRDLHDRTSSNLSALLLSVAILRRKLPAASLPELGPRFDDTEALLRETMLHVRDVLEELRPPALDDLGLLAALNHHAQVLTLRSGVEIGVHGAEPSPRLPPATEISLFRIAQEALNNATRDAQATRIDVSIRTDAARVTLLIADDGIGFDVSARPIGASSLGLVTMRERAEAMNAQFRVESSAGKGTRITVVIPQQERATGA